MNRTRLLALPLRVALAVTSAAALGGCAEDVGSCEGELEARDTVRVGGSVQFAGQAILNQSCANNVCHASNAQGAARNGAPAGLDFDLKPIVDIDEEDENDDGTVIGRIDEEELAGLHGRQSDVVEKRNIIWQQVVDGLMPPDGMWAGLRKLANILDTQESEPCTGSTDASLDPLDTPATREILRNWLACGAPIVEAGTDLVAKREPGTVGYQYPMCTGDEPEGNTIEAVQARVFNDCAGCHTDSNNTDLTSAETSYAALVEDDAIACNDKPFVTKGDVTESYLYDLLTEEEPGCHARMPFGMDPLSDDDIEFVRAWIEEGALREGE